jgi:hypothetical protein
MGDEVCSPIIKLSFLRELQQVFQKDLRELLEMYLHDAKRKLANLHKALEEQNWSNFKAAAKELRYRSIDIGAIQFSYDCLALEIAVQELRIDNLKSLTCHLEVKFSEIRDAIAHIIEEHENR